MNNLQTDEDFRRADEAFRKRSIPVGHTETFDRKAQRLRGKQVLLTAKVNAESWKSLQLDRGDNLEPISVVAYSK